MNFVSNQDGGSFLFKLLRNRGTIFPSHLHTCFIWWFKFLFMTCVMVHDRLRVTTVCDAYVHQSWFLYLKPNQIVNSQSDLRHHGFSMPESSVLSETLFFKQKNRKTLVELNSWIYELAGLPPRMNLLDAKSVRLKRTKWTIGNQ